jgi:putative membrane protein
MWCNLDQVSGWMIFGGIWSLLVFILIILLIIWAVNKYSGKDTKDRISPLDIARERYAKGEISREEFEQIKKDLQ